MAVKDSDVKFFYKGKYLGSCDPRSMECDKVYDLLKRDKGAATQVLNYLNSFGDPIFPISDEEWSVAETNVDNVDIRELYNTFMLWLEKDYEDFPDDFVIDGDMDLPDFTIFDGEVADGVNLDEACGYKKKSKKEASISRKDDYKVKQIDIMIADMEDDFYETAKLRTSNSKTIDLDIGALELLRDYYS